MHTQTSCGKARATKAAHNRLYRFGCAVSDRWGMSAHVHVLSSTGREVNLWVVWVQWVAPSHAQEIGSDAFECMGKTNPRNPPNPLSDAMAWQSILEKHPDHVRLIGMLSIENANLEMELAALLARMLSIPLRIGRPIYLTPQSAHARLDLFRNKAKAAFRGARITKKKNTPFSRLSHFEAKRHGHQ